MKERKKIIYLRVSKQDLKTEKKILQDLEQQLPPILNKFNLNKSECEIIRDKGSAYDISKLHNRFGLMHIFGKMNIEYISILKLFKNRAEDKANIDLYVFDYNRLFRNIEFGLLFALLCYFLDVKIYSVSQEDLNTSQEEDINSKMGKYVRLALYSYMAEGYSKNISDHTKKSIIHREGITLSSKGNLWGKGCWTDTEGNKVSLSLKKYKNMRNYVLECLTNNPNLSEQYIIDNIARLFNIRVSRGFITGRKKELRFSKNG